MKIKKKDIITASVIAVLLILIVGGCVMLASRHRNTEYAPPIRSISQRNLFFEGTPTLDIAEYVNGEPFNRYYGNTENGILFLVCFLRESQKTLFFKYNTLNGNIAKIESEIKYNISSDIYAASGFIYYFKSDDGEYKQKYLCRIPTSGGNEQVLAEYDLGNQTSATLHFVAENKVIFSIPAKIFAYDLEKNEPLTLFDASKNGFDMINSDFWYYGGNLYFTAISETRENNIPTAENFPDYMTPAYSSYLITLNMKTKEYALLFEEPINCFYMTADEIIYIPKVHRVTEIYGQPMPLYNEKICACDLDGKNSREIFSNLDVWGYEILGYKDGKIYVSDGYAETAKVSTWVIDINTGDASIYRGEEKQ